ncbi:MAG: hypothetical protein WBL61_23680 [Bryobacteraceae bacterium]|jgi:hypothetical protein
MQQKRNKKLISGAAYAKLRGLNRSTIARQIRSGLIPTCDGLVDPVAADAARERNLDPDKVAQAEHRKSNPLPSESNPQRAPVPEVTSPPEPEPKGAGDSDSDGGQAPEEYWAARTRHEITRANRAQLDFALAEGKLVAVEDVCSRWAAMGRTVQDQLTGLHNRIVARLPMEWQKQVAIVVREETRRLALFLADELAKEDGLPWTSAVTPGTERPKGIHEQRTV